MEKEVKREMRKDTERELSGLVERYAQCGMKMD